MKTNGLDFVAPPTLCFNVYITNFSTFGSYDCYPNFPSFHFNKDIASLFSDSLEIEFLNFFYILLLVEVSIIDLAHYLDSLVV